MSVLSRQQRWEEMPAAIDDEVLHTYVAVGTYADSVDELRQRYGDLVSRIEFSIPVDDERDREQLQEMVAKLQGDTG